MHADAHSSWLIYVALSMPLSGILLAYLEFGRKASDRKGFVERIPVLAELFSQRWYLDRLYQFLVHHVVDRGLSALCATNDRKVIDGGLDGFSKGIVGAGRRVSLRHVGRLQQKLFVMFAVMVLTALYFIW